MGSLGVIIGRFQPLHNGHTLNQIVPAAGLCDHVLIVVGSANCPRSNHNPWNLDERVEMIESTWPSLQLRSSLHITPADDFPGENTRWQVHIIDIVGKFRSSLGASEVILFSGHEPYLHFLPWTKHTSQRSPISGTIVRRLIRRGSRLWEMLVPVEVQGVILSSPKWSQHNNTNR